MYFDGEIYFSNSEHCHSAASDSGDLEWNVNTISRDEQEFVCFDEISINCNY